VNRKIRIIFFLCIITIIVFSAWSAIRSLRPSRGKVYEQLSVEEAVEYMSFEPAYCIVDVRTKEDYDAGHVENARSLPLEEIVEQADEAIAGREMMIYVYGYDSDSSCAAAQKLSDMGFTSVTETGSYEDWTAAGAAMEKTSERKMK
jgi:rhodanese-related sulfurtransferase